MRVFGLFAVLLIAGLCAAQQYYADVTVDVSPGGSASVSGTTNHPSLNARMTDSLTSKRGSFWLFNLTLPTDDRFSDFFFDVRLPQGASVNYVKASGQFRITSYGGRISVRGTGSDEPLWVLVQYQLSQDIEPPQATDAQTPDYYYLAGAVLAASLVAAFVVWMLRRGGRTTAPKTPEEAECGYGSEPAPSDPNVLTDRQKAIMDLLRAEGKPVNQALVCERLGLPKSSVSRNVDTLEKIGLIVKTRNGMSTMLSLKG